MMEHKHLIRPNALQPEPSLCGSALPPSHRDNLHPFIPVHFRGEHSPQPESAVNGGFKVHSWGFTQFGVTELFFQSWLRKERHWRWLFHVEPSDATQSLQPLQGNSQNVV